LEEGGGWEVRRKERWGRRNNDKFMWLNIFSKNFTSCTIRVEKKTKIKEKF
jgi:hypothetical protein